MFIIMYPLIHFSTPEKRSVIEFKHSANRLKCFEPVLLTFIPVTRDTPLAIPIIHKLILATRWKSNSAVWFYIFTRCIPIKSRRYSTASANRWIAYQ